MKQELKKIFKIDLDNIETRNNIYEYINEAVEKMREHTYKNNFEIILNENLLDIKEIPTGIHTLCGCRISLEKLEKDISFIIREDKKPSYEILEQRIDKAIEYIENNNFYKTGMTEEGICYVVSCDKKELLDILKGSDNND